MLELHEDDDYCIWWLLYLYLVHEDGVGYLGESKEELQYCQIEDVYPWLGVMVPMYFFYIL